MKTKHALVPKIQHDDIKSKIYSMRGMQVMLDRDIAELYKVATKILNQAVKRNLKRFPDEFMFQLTKEETDNWRSQIVTSNSIKMGLRYRPYAFTEHGVLQVASVLNSDTAIKMSVQIIHAFVEMRKFLLSNAQIFQRLDSVERKQIEYKLDSDKKFEKVFETLEQKDIHPKQGVFFEGRVFDAYTVVLDIIRTAKKSIVIIDNYIDDTVLTMLTKRRKNVSATILTREISSQLALDIKKHNAQYPAIEIREFKISHDRFIIIDNTDVYTVGASLKDVGKRWFSINKFGAESLAIVEELKSKFSS